MRRLGLELAHTSRAGRLSPSEENDMRTATFVTTSLTLLLGTVAFAQSVTYDFDRSADFSRYRTYAWVPGTNVDDELNHNRIVRAVEAQLAAKGLSKVERSANP